MPDAFAHHDRRMSTAMASGLSIVNELVDAQPYLQSLMTRLMVLAEEDPQLAFLQMIPEGPVLSMMRANALEKALFGVETREVAELALMIGLFTIMLDGLLDEAPEHLRPISAWLDSLMRLGRESDGPPQGNHPVADALAWSGSRAVTRARQMPGWNDHRAREEFTRATDAAYRTELLSVSCRITDARTGLHEQRERVLGKSTSCIWAGALIPTVVHGWPNGIDPGAFERLARSIGAFGGWIDDIMDLAEDLKADRWNMPLFEILTMVSLLDTNTGPESDIRRSLADGLTHPLIAGRLPFVGTLRLIAVRDALRESGIDERHILPVLADVSEACLMDGLR